MKNTKKGFTLVELLVVIAILAILATVAVVGYTSFTKKADLSVDQQAVAQLNTALTAGSVGLKAEEITIKNVCKILTENGFNLENGVNALRSGNKIYWFKDYNKIVLADGEGKVAAPTDDAKLVEDFKANFNDTTKVFDLAALVQGSSVVVNGAVVGSFDDALAAGGEITLFNDVELSSTLVIAKDTTINLNGNNIDASALPSGRLFSVEKDGVTLTINAEGSEVKFGAYGLVALKGQVNEPAINVSVVINGGTFEGEMDNGAFIKAVSNVAATVELNNVTYKDNTNINVTGDVGLKVSYITDISEDTASINLKVNGGTYDADCGFGGISKGEFKNVTINSRGYSIYGGNYTVENCTLTTTSIHNVDGYTPAACVAVSGGGSATVTGSTLTAEGGNAVAIYTSGGKITMQNCEVNGNYAEFHDSNFSNYTFEWNVDKDITVVYPNCGDNCGHID